MVNVWECLHEPEKPVNKEKRCPAYDLGAAS